MKRLIIATMLTALSTVAIADTVIITKTQTWKSVPITVDSASHTYTTVDTTVPEGDFYYTYSGYRCVKDKMDIAGVDPLVYRSNVAGGVDLYCYPE